MKACKKFQAALVLEDLDRKRTLAKELRAALADLSEWLIEKDIPDYLLQLTDLLERYQAQKAPGTDVLSKLVETQSNLPFHVWPDEDDSTLALDLDTIFAAFVGQSRLPELLNLLLDLLLKLEAESEDNSALIRVSLERAIATIKLTRGASFSSLKMAWGFVMRLLGNLFWEQTAALLPGAIPLINALRKTIEDTDKELKRAEGYIESEVKIFVEKTALLSGDNSLSTLYDVRGGVLALSHSQPSIKGNA